MTHPEYIPPVQLHLAEQYAAALEALRAGVPQVRRWAELGNAERAALAVRLTDAMRQLLATAESMRALPASTACVCPACAVVRLPATSSGDVFACECGRVWMVQGRAGHLRLPDGFWDQAMPGQGYAGSVQAAWAEEDAA